MPTTIESSSRRARVQGRRASQEILQSMARRLVAVLALAPMLAQPPQLAVAQSPAPRPLLDRVRALGLQSSTDRITVHFDRGHEAKAVRLRTMVQDALRFFADSLGDGAAPDLTLAVVERATWEQLDVGQPYGIPGVDGTPPVAFIPATDDGLAATDALGIEAGISDTARRILAAAGLDWGTASRRYVDLVGLHEMGHAFAESYGIATRSRWFGEFLATYFAWSYLQAARPAEAAMWSGILQGYRDAVRPAHRTLADFERLYFGVGAQNYVWYQARFQQQVADVHARFGVGFLRAARAAFPPGATPPRSLGELTARLEGVAPGFAQWAGSMR